MSSTEERLAKLRATFAKKREQQRIWEAEETARLRVTPEEAAEFEAEQAAESIAEGRKRFTLSEDGAASARLRVPRDPRCCAFTHLDGDDIDKLARFTLYGRIREGGRLQPFLIGRGVNGESYWSLPRLLLEVDDIRYSVRYLNGNALDNRRMNLAVYRLGQFPIHKSYAPGWGQMRKQAWARAGGVCEVCGQRPAVEVHHRIPGRFFKSAEDSNFLPNLVCVCGPCHHAEHLKLPLELPLFFGLVAPGTNFAPACAQAAPCDSPARKCVE